ncbi:hypothetical protein Hanom_Chr12g01077191 [Helianthus anomalus]
MMHLAVSAKSCLWSQTLLGLRAITGNSTNDFASTVTRIERRGLSAIHTFKAKAMRMDDDERRFPPQHQESQPGKEYLMNPLPQFSNPNYKPSGKLHVLSIHYFFNLF